MTILCNQSYFFNIQKTTFMAHSNSFFGLRRGSTKSMTFSVLRGQQITKDRVSDVANPRSKAQMSQRASFADVVKFYKHANQNLFRFAFEGKKATESDYNAFVRLNVGKAVIINKLQQDNVNFPAIGDNWQLAEGSLPECGIIKHVSEGPSGMLGTQYALSVPSIKATDTTIGQLSTALIADYGLQLNDIVTICYVTTTVLSLNSAPTEAPKWELLQFRVNPDDVTPMLDYKLGVSSGTTGEVAWNVDAQGLSLISLYAEGFSVIFSRVQQGQPLKVSNAFLNNSATADRMIADSKMDFYRSSALTSWGATEEAILQGSLSKVFEPTPTPPVVNNIIVDTLALMPNGVKSSNILEEIGTTPDKYVNGSIRVSIYDSTTAFPYNAELTSDKSVVYTSGTANIRIQLVQEGDHAPGDIYVDQTGTPFKLVSITSADVVRQFVTE